MGSGCWGVSVVLLARGIMWPLGGGGGRPHVIYRVKFSEPLEVFQISRFRRDPESLPLFGSRGRDGGKAWQGFGSKASFRWEAAGQASC